MFKLCRFLFIIVISISVSFKNMVFGQAPDNTKNITDIDTIKPLDHIAVFVNKGVITEGEINAHIKRIIAQSEKNKVLLPAISDLRIQVENQLIMQKIQLDLAKQYGIVTTDVEVNEALNNLVKNRNTSTKQLVAILGNGGSEDELREQIKIQLTLEKLKQYAVDSHVKVNNNEVERILNSETYKKKKDYDLSNILIVIPEGATSTIINDKQLLIDQAYNALKSGEVFDKVVMKYSNSPNALSGGKLGWKSSATLPAIITAQLDNLKVGEVTKPIQLPIGFFIFKLDGIKDNTTKQIVKQYHVRHILIKVNGITSDNEAYQRIVNIRNMLEKYKNDPKKLASHFEQYAKQFSEDTSSINGGEIGWIGKGDTVPVFEQTVFNLPVGQISEPIRSPFGWHILEVLGQRNADLTADKEKVRIRQELYEIKDMALYQQWLHDIREKAYVKINDSVFSK